ncbi:hypothetical protein Taro_015929 [Colocasia esculenta]|uniref:Uncharacterized protein n=1 Tax=Colocasia esculenta TaxID=4460 RepID=A0A843UNR4_COLES|nr:hypothetical protein [Colocasia esculenta]
MGKRLGNKSTPSPFERTLLPSFTLVAALPREQAPTVVRLHPCVELEIIAYQRKSHSKGICRQLGSGCRQLGSGCRQLGSGCRQLVSSQNQFLGSDTICRQTRVGCRQLNLRLSTHPHRSLQDVEVQYL